MRSLVRLLVRITKGFHSMQPNTNVAGGFVEEKYGVRTYPTNNVHDAAD